jgi:hypothetical protein
MITDTWTKAPADLLGLGGFDVRLCTERPVPFSGTGLPAGATAVRLRQVAGQAGYTAPMAFAHNSIGTTLGIHPSGRPLS